LAVVFSLCYFLALGYFRLLLLSVPSDFAYLNSGIDFNASFVAPARNQLVIIVLDAA